MQTRWKIIIYVSLFLLILIVTSIYFFSIDYVCEGKDCINFSSRNLTISNLSNENLTRQILKSAEDCVILDNPPIYRAYCTQNCLNCESGNYTCWGGSTKIPNIKNKCVECAKDRDCKTGFGCNGYTCVKIQETCAELGGTICLPNAWCVGGDGTRSTDSDYCCLGSCG